MLSKLISRVSNRSEWSFLSTFFKSIKFCVKYLCYVCAEKILVCSHTKCKIHSFMVILGFSLIRLTLFYSIIWRNSLGRALLRLFLQISLIFCVFCASVSDGEHTTPELDFVILLLPNHQQPPVFQVLDPLLEVQLGGQAAIGKRKWKAARFLSAAASLWTFSLLSVFFFLQEVSSWRWATPTRRQTTWSSSWLTLPFMESWWGETTTSAWVTVTKTTTSF